MPADERPDLYVYGESLGTFSTDSAFTSVEDLSTTTDGALLVGPPSFDTTWQRLQAERDPESPLWQPRYNDGALVRVASDEESLLDPSLVWKTDNRIVYLVNSSDPIVAWTSDHAEWLDPTRTRRTFRRPRPADHFQPPILGRPVRRRTDRPQGMVTSTAPSSCRRGRRFSAHRAFPRQRSRRSRKPSPR